MSNPRADTQESQAEGAAATDETSPNDATAEQAAKATEPGEATTASEATEAAAGDGEADQTAKLESEVADLRDQLLRTLAEAENQRRRSQREREDAVRYAGVPLVRDLLAVADNLSRALESVPKDAAEGEGALKTLLEGVRLTERELQAAFERHGIVKLDPLGERLNPHHHEAMFEIPDPDQPAGTIAQVVQSGYLLHDRLLRPARVGVAKGGPLASQADSTCGPDEDQATDAEDTTASDTAEPGNGPPGSRIDTSA